MTTAPPSGRLDERTWSAATRSSPIVFQFVLCVLLVTTWLRGRWSLIHQTADPPRTALLLATAITVVSSLVVASSLHRQTSVTTSAIGISTAGSAAVILMGAVSYALWVL